MSIFGSIKNAFRSIQVHVAPVLIAIFGKDAAHDLGAAIVASLQTGLGKITLSTVEALLTLKVDGRDATSAEKRAAAFKQVLDVTKQQGLNVGESAINLMIELAVQRLKNVTPIQ